MVLFNHRIERSKINSLGVFTNEKKILFNMVIQKKTNTYKLDFDTVLRFLNFSEDRNIYQDKIHNETYLIAKRDIKIEEKIIIQK